MLETPKGEIESIVLDNPTISPEALATWIVPVASMLEKDVLPLFRTKPQALSGVFIGPADRGFIEANAFRIACVNEGIQPKTVFLIENNTNAINSTEKNRKALERVLIKNQITRMYLQDDTIKIDKDAYTIFTAIEFKKAVQDNKTLPAIVLIKGDANDPDLANAIHKASNPSEKTSLLVLGRNIDSLRFNYAKTARTWRDQLSRGAKVGAQGLLAFTVCNDIPFFWKSYLLLFRMQLWRAFGGRRGRPHEQFSQSELSSQPNLIKRGAPYSDQYIFSLLFPTAA